MKRTILVVEDDLLNRLFYEAALAASGFAVVSVDDGAQALAAVARHQPDLVIMDVHLPNVSGHDLIVALRADGATRQLPVLAVTAFAGKGEEMRLRRAGANGYLAKPVRIAELVAQITALLSEDCPRG